MSQSVPHIYLSALPFAPEKSKVSQTYLPRYPGVLQVQSGKMVSWPLSLNVFKCYGEGMISLAFSPDGKHIVLGSYERPIRMWETDTCGVVPKPSTGYAHWVDKAVMKSPSFSPDGKFISTGGNVWDAETGDIIPDRKSVV